MHGPLVWVIGRGLLGRHLQRSRLAGLEESAEWSPSTGPFPWDNEEKLRASMQCAVSEFIDRAKTEGKDWAILWAAGAGVIGTSAEDIQRETSSWKFFLEALGCALREKGGNRRGAIFLASSAGGIYAGSPDSPITENSAVAPISEYGRNKIEQETLLQDFAATHSQVSFLIGRISNLYGVGQNFSKPQGLVAHISRAILHRSTINIYVSLDTVRDYIFAPECAELIWRCLRRIFAEGGLKPSRIVKIIAAEEPTTIAQVIGIYKQLVRHHPLILFSRNAVGAEQPNRLCFKSVVWRDLHPAGSALLTTTIPFLHRKHFEMFVAGKLPPPR